MVKRLILTARQRGNTIKLSPARCNLVASERLLLGPPPPALTDASLDATPQINIWYRQYDLFEPPQPYWPLFY